MAKISLDEIIDFLSIRWTAKEFNVLKNDIKNFRKIMTDDMVKHSSLKVWPDIKYMLIGKKQISCFMK